MEFELKINGKAADLPERPLECCSNIAYSDLSFVSWDACANNVSASRAEQSRAEQSRAEQSRAERTNLFCLTPARSDFSGRNHKSYPVISPRNEALRLRSGILFFSMRHTTR